RLNPCTQTIDLRGRTAVPGLIDNHNHIVLLGMRPGHDVRLDRVFSLADLRAAIQARAQKVPAGEWITAMGGWNQIQFAEKRMPARLRLFMYTQDTQLDTPILKERLLNNFAEFGDDMLRVSGIGEQAVGWNGAATSPALFEAGLKLIAQHGWTFQQHSLSLAE